MDKFVIKDFHNSIYQGNIELVRKLLAEQPQLLKWRTERGGNLLHVAVQQRDGSQIEMTRWLCDQGLDVNQQNGDGMSPLWISVCRFSSLETAETLLDLQANPNVSYLGQTLLTFLVLTDEVTEPLSFMKLLLERGANPDQMSIGQTPLHSAASNGKQDSALLLIEHGADPYVPFGVDNFNAFQIAECWGYKTLADDMRAWVQAREARQVIRRTAESTQSLGLKPLAFRAPELN